MHKTNDGKHGINTIKADCPDNWIKHIGQCYLFVDHTTLDWNDTFNFCKNFDSELAEVETAIEENFLEQHVRQLGKGIGFWLGGSDIILEGEWMWMTSKTLLSMAYTAWKPGEPNNEGNNEHCLEIQWNSFLWNDTPCDQQRHFICERASHPGGDVIG
ncbi:perlucin-like [Saccostrea echinata]|uniref:perlucin-like n=1 Tax=Saccostrea echinata TaxID=191078 RepID=UPI002A82CF20|nr:perlucin-like [Saccostrea echinata]